ncbi:MAG: ATP-dependent zinc protease [Gammaproteobacteria bacterium]|nr:ATP-dependent zinc protease [Gammaproteobacteria bacterium]MDX5374288.1 ATP-dependent zinc protease [Gammaproteobacteria bacterium]
MHSNRLLTRLLPLLAAVGLLAGCASLQPPAKRPVSQEQFEARLDALETRLLTHLEALSSRHHTRIDRMDEELLSIRDELQWIQQTQAIQAEKLGRVLREDNRNEETEVVQTGQMPSDNKIVLGRQEWVGFPDIGTYLKARVDSGANTSSLSAREITDFERDGEEWVRFKLALADDEDDVVERVRDRWIEAPLLRKVRIIQAAGTDTRPVVRLLMTLGPIRQEVEFTLNDRTDLSYPVLLGRRFMMDIADIDVSRKYIYERPEFPEPVDGQGETGGNGD